MDPYDAVVQNKQECYAFRVEHHDKIADLNRQYQLLYYPEDSSVVLYDLTNKKLFLKRFRMPNLSLDDFYVGGTVIIQGRQMHIAAFFDAHTAERLTSDRETCLVVVSGQGLERVGDVISLAIKNNYVIFQLEQFNLSSGDCAAFERGCSPEGPVQPGPAAVLLLQKTSCISAWRSQMKSLSSTAGIVTSTSKQESNDMAAFFFDGNSRRQRWSNGTMRPTRSTAALIKPHVRNQTGVIVREIIEAGFRIVSLRQILLQPADAAEFLEVYNGVLSSFERHTAELCGGSLTALEVEKDGLSQADVVKEFRALCGPSDSALAAKLRPDTIRARYGVDNIQNALHCTDIPENAESEVDYLFGVLYRLTLS